MQHTYRVGDRIERESTIMGVTEWTSGTVISTVPDADSYYVSFDHMWESEPTLSNAENMRYENSNPTPKLHPMAQTAKEWGEIKKRTNTIGTSGDRVYYLLPTRNTEIREGYLSDVLSNGDRKVVDSETGSTYCVASHNVRQWFER